MAERTRSDGEQLLRLIEAGTVRLRVGIDALMLRHRWRQAGGDDGVLAECLDRMQADGLIEIVPDDAMSVRLTPAGLVRVRDLGVDDPERSGRRRGGIWRLRRGPDEAAARPVSAQVMRNDLLEMLREIGVAAGRWLRASAAQSAWIESGRRAEGLRIAIDLCQRDGYIQLDHREHDTRLRTTPDGEHYAAGRPTPSALLDRAPPLGDAAVHRRGVTQHHRLLVAADALHRAGHRDSFLLSDLAQSLGGEPGDTDSVIQLADLFHRYSLADLPDPAWLQFVFTDEGRELMRRSQDSAYATRLTTAREQLRHAGADHA